MPRSGSVGSWVRAAPSGSVAERNLGKVFVLALGVLGAPARCSSALWVPSGGRAWGAVRHGRQQRDPRRLGLHADAARGAERGPRDGVRRLAKGFSGSASCSAACSRRASIAWSGRGARSSSPGRSCRSCALATWRPIDAPRGSRDRGRSKHLDLLRQQRALRSAAADGARPARREPVARVVRAGRCGHAQGRPGDHYLLIADGEVDVSDDARALGTSGPVTASARSRCCSACRGRRRSTARTGVSGFTIDGPASSPPSPGRPQRRPPRRWPRRVSSTPRGGALAARRRLDGSATPRRPAVRRAPSPPRPPSTRGRPACRRSSRCTPACRSGRGRRG